MNKKKQEHLIRTIKHLEQVEHISHLTGCFRVLRRLGLIETFITKNRNESSDAVRFDADGSNKQEKEDEEYKKDKQEEQEEPEQEQAEQQAE